MDTCKTKKILKPYKVTIPKKSLRKPKALYETLIISNNSQYRNSELLSIKSLPNLVKTLKTVENIDNSKLQSLNELMDSMYTNHLIATGSMRSNGLESKDATLYMVAIHRIPKYNSITDNVDGFEYIIQYNRHTDKEIQLGQFAKYALISGCQYVNGCNSMGSIKSNINFVIANTSKNNTQLMSDNNRLEQLYAESYKSVQNKELFHNMYIAKKMLPNCRYKVLTSESLKFISELLD